MRNKKVLIEEKIYAVLLKDARTKGMTPEEIVELLLRREYKMPQQHGRYLRKQTEKEVRHTQKNG